MKFLSKFNQFSGKIRLAVFLSFLWLFFAWFKTPRVYGFSWKKFIGWGIVPLFAIWGFWWVLKGYEKDEEADN
ncbi:MAG: hypothetical protein HQ552_01290 [Desulfobacteraceae bacterium]|nr:hypothetical protein [Desulfobacteraceae bacterium]